MMFKLDYCMTKLHARTRIFQCKSLTVTTHFILILRRL